MLSVSNRRIRNVGLDTKYEIPNTNLVGDFSFVKDLGTGKFIIVAPHRFDRPTETQHSEPACPFEEEKHNALFEEGGVRVFKNNFPFAPIHELIVYSHEHEKDLVDLDTSTVEQVLKVYQSRFDLHQKDGQVYIFCNSGLSAGESLPHPHSQLVVIPEDVKLEIPPLRLASEDTKELEHFYFFCPQTSFWPDEVWIAPKREGRIFVDTTPDEAKELGSILQKLIQALEKRYENDFPYNFYIYPGSSWYLRLIPRAKTLGGFELGTGVGINTKDPVESFEFLKNNF